MMISRREFLKMLGSAALALPFAGLLVSNNNKTAFAAETSLWWAQVPIDATIFCATPDGNTSKFNSGEWHGTYGCPGDINELYFPDSPNLIRQTESDFEDGMQQAATTISAAVQQASTIVTPSSLPA